MFLQLKKALPIKIVGNKIVDNDFSQFVQPQRQEALGTRLEIRDKIYSRHIIMNKTKI